MMGRSFRCLAFHPNFTRRRFTGDFPRVFVYQAQSGISSYLEIINDRIKKQKYTNEMEGKYNLVRDETHNISFKLHSPISITLLNYLSRPITINL